MKRSPCRTFQLSKSSDPTAVRLLSGNIVSLDDDDKPQTWVTLCRTGSFTDPRYGRFEINRDIFLSMVSNFHKNTYGQKIFIDLNHKPQDGAAGEVMELSVEGHLLRALVEWSPLGIEAITKRKMVYLSAEFNEKYKDNEAGNEHGAVLLGAALTVRPVIKGLDSVQLSENDSDHPVYIHPELIKTLAAEANHLMNKHLKKLLATWKSQGLTEASITTLSNTFTLSLGESPEEAFALSLSQQFEDAGKEIAEQLKINPSAPITLSIAGGTGLDAAAVTKLLADHDAAKDAKTIKLAEDREAKVTLFADTVAKAEGLDAATQKELCESVRDLITADLSDGQIIGLAQLQIKQANATAVSRHLGAMGFPVQGSTHIEVGTSGDLKTLSEHTDQRLGIKSLADADRFETTGGVLTAKNKALAEKVLATFDRSNAVALMAESRQLAAGAGSVSDVALPVSFERSVIREALYQMTGTQLVDVMQGTVPFASVVEIPYSYRDISAAGRRDIRRYQGQGIPNAGVIQTTCEARPVPQKLGFMISDELRYLMTAGKINWDAVIENRANASRIIAEDTDMLLHNELLNAADEFAAVAVVGETVAGLDGAKTTFPLAQWPVVRPRMDFDLKGNQVGNTLNPITVTLAAALITEFDGTGAQLAGNYYSLDYNLGEITVVNALGVPQAPALNSLVVNYSAVSNVARFNTDLGGVKQSDFWDTFLTVFAGRRDVIQDDRFHKCNFSSMSGTSMTQIEQALTFGANFARPGTDLAANGDLGRIKAVSAYRAAAPGIAIGDQRIVLGEKGSTKFSLSKLWSMNQLENQRDASGKFTGEKASYGDQFIVVKTPDPLKRAYTSVGFYSATGRVAR